MTLIRVEEGDVSAFVGDAVVNAANNHLRLGSGVAGAILQRGGGSIQDECDQYVRDNGPIAVGEAAVTGAGLLSVQFVIHAAAMGDEPTSAETIRSATANSLRLAMLSGVRSIAFPVLGTGVGGFPYAEAARTMVDEIQQFCAAHPESLDSVVLYGFRPEQADTIRRMID